MFVGPLCSLPVPWNPIILMHACSYLLYLPLCTPQSLPSFLSALHPNYVPATCFQIPFWVLLDQLELILFTSKHSQMLSSPLQLLSYPLCSPYGSLLELLRCAPCTNRSPQFPLTFSSVLHFPLYAPRSPLIPPQILRSPLFLSVSA